MGKRIFQKGGIQVLEDIVNGRPTFIVHAGEEFEEKHARKALNKILDRVSKYQRGSRLVITGPGASRFDQLRENYWFHLEVEGDLGPITGWDGSHLHEYKQPLLGTGSILGIVAGFLGCTASVAAGLPPEIGISLFAGSTAGGVGLDVLAEIRFLRANRRFKATRYLHVPRSEEKSY